MKKSEFREYFDSIEYTYSVLGLIKSVSFLSNES